MALLQPWHTLSYQAFLSLPVQVEITKCVISLGSLMSIWQAHGVNDDNRLTTSW